MFRFLTALLATTALISAGAFVPAHAQGGAGGGRLCGAGDAPGGAGGPSVPGIIFTSPYGVTV